MNLSIRYINSFQDCQNTGFNILFSLLKEDWLNLICGSGLEWLLFKSLESQVTPIEFFFQLGAIESAS